MQFEEITLRNSRRDIEYDNSESEDSDVNDRYNWIEDSISFLTPKLMKINSKSTIQDKIRKNLSAEVANEFS